MGLSGDLAGQQIKIRFRGEMRSHVKREKIADLNTGLPFLSFWFEIRTV